MSKLPDLDDSCGRHFVYRDFVECGNTWKLTGIRNVPTQPATYLALEQLATRVLDPVMQEFGTIRLTYGIACPALTRRIKHGISPRIDQHASHEVSASGLLVCSRGGASCDFEIDGYDALTVAQWLVGNTEFDRLYYYGSDRPIHVSSAPDAKGQIVRVIRRADSRRVRPVVIAKTDFLSLSIGNEESNQ